MSEWGKKKPKVKKASGGKGKWGADYEIGEGHDPFDDAMSEVFSDGSDDENSYEPEEDGLSLRAGSEHEQGWRRMFYKMMTPKSKEGLVHSRATELGFRLFMESRMNEEEEAQFRSGDEEGATAKWHKRLFYDVNPFPTFTGKEDEKTGAKYKAMGQLSRVGNTPGTNMGLYNFSGILKGLKPSERNLLYSLLRTRQGLKEGAGQEVWDEIAKNEVGDATKGLKTHSDRARALKAVLEDPKGSANIWTKKLLALERFANLPVAEGGFGRRTFQATGLEREGSGKGEAIEATGDDVAERDKAKLDKQGEEFWEGYRNQLRKEGVKVAQGKPKAEHDLGKKGGKPPFPRAPPEPQSEEEEEEEEEPAPEDEDDNISVRSKLTQKTKASIAKSARSVRSAFSGGGGGGGGGDYGGEPEGEGFPGEEAQPLTAEGRPIPGHDYNPTKFHSGLKKSIAGMTDEEVAKELKDLEPPEDPAEKAPYFERFNELLNRLAMEQEHTYPTLKKPQMVMIKDKEAPGGERLVEAGKPYDYYEQTHALTGKPRHDVELGELPPGDVHYITNRKGLLDALSKQMDAGRIEKPVKGRAGQPLTRLPSYKLSEETWESLVATTGKQETNSLRVKNDKGIGELPRNVYLIEGGRVVQDPDRAEETEIGHFSQTQMGADGKPLFVIEPGRLASLPGKPTRLLPQPFTPPAPKPPRSGSVAPRGGVSLAPQEPHTALRPSSPPRRPTAVEMAGGGGGGGGERVRADDEGSVGGQSLAGSVASSNYQARKSAQDAGFRGRVIKMGGRGVGEIQSLDDLNALMAEQARKGGRPAPKPITFEEPKTPEERGALNASIARNVMRTYFPPVPKGVPSPGINRNELIKLKAQWRPYSEDEVFVPSAWGISTKSPQNAILGLIGLVEERLDRTGLWEFCRSVLGEDGKPTTVEVDKLKEGEVEAEETRAYAKGAVSFKKYMSFVENKLQGATFAKALALAKTEAERGALFDSVFAPWKSAEGGWGGKTIADTFENRDVVRLLGLAKRLWVANPFTTHKPKTPAEEAGGGGGAGGGKK